jgi:pyruvate,water dikinase
MGEERWVVDDEPGDKFPVWTRGNVGEVFPEVVNPLTWSLYGAAADEGWKDAFVEFGALAPDDYDPGHRSVVGVFGGYAYLNVSAVRFFAHRTPVVKVADIDRSLFGEQNAPEWHKPAGARRVGRSLRALRSLLSTVTAKQPPPGVAADAQEVDAWRAALADPAAASDDDLVAGMRDFSARFRSLFCRHILVSFQASVATSLVGQLVGSEALVPALIAGIGDVESAMPSAALWKLGRQVAADPALTAAFDAGPDGLAGRLAGTAFAPAFAEFLTRYGYRGPNEWDVGATTWDANPAGALAAIDSLRRTDPSHDPAAQGTRLTGEREAAIAQALAIMPARNRGRFRKAVHAATILARSREHTKSTVIRAIHGPRLAARVLAQRGIERGGPAEADRFYLLKVDELAAYLADPGAMAATLAARAALREELVALVPPFVFDRRQPPREEWTRRQSSAPPVAAGTTLTGIGACPGVAKGRARVVLDPFDPHGLGPGDVLVAPITDPSWTPLFLMAEAVVVDVGAAMSHAVIVSRELGIPAVVSVTGATTTIPDGALVEVDGTAGTVRILEV